MKEFITFIQNNWQWVLLVFYVLEKIVKATKTKYDDILVDILFGALKKLTGKSGDKEEKGK